MRDIIVDWFITIVNHVAKRDHGFCYLKRQYICNDVLLENGAIINIKM